MFKLIRRITLLTILMGTFFTVSALATNMGAGTVNASVLNLREAASTDAKILTLAPRGTGFILKEKVDDSWYHVWYRGTEGYMAAEFVNLFLEGLDGNFGIGTVQGTTVRMRAEANTSSTVIGTYDTGAVMQIAGVYGAWYRVNYNGQYGYIHSDFMYIKPPAAWSSGTDAANTVSNVSSTSSVGQAIVETARQFYGVPYIWAGTSPKGFDCSGFVYYVYKQHGYNINRTAASIYQNGVAVDKSNLQIGDVICFTNGGGSYIGHVGIYIGDNQFIHASSGQGKVTITGLSETYYANHYYGARRIV